MGDNENDWTKKEYPTIGELKEVEDCVHFMFNRREHLAVPLPGEELGVTKDFLRVYRRGTEGEGEGVLAERVGGEKIEEAARRAYRKERLRDE